MVVGERGMVAPHLRGSPIYQQLSQVGSSFIQERHTESLGRYVMLKVMYRLGSRGVGAARGGGGGRRR